MIFKNRHFFQHKRFAIPFALFAFLLGSLISTAVQATNITVTSSRNPVALDDSFHLIFEANSSVDDDPDFSPIYKNFDVLSSSQSTNMRSVNGSWDLQKTWNLTVIAKKVGKHTIPSIQFGSDISPAILITVSNSTSSNSASPNGQATIPAKIFLESSVDKKSGWVQSQFIYSVRILRTVNWAGASLSEPTTNDADAILQKVSEDNFQTTRNGIRYEVFERRYAIYPQKSGSLRINPITFEARINAAQPKTIFDSFRMSGQLKRLRSKAIDITVKAAPSNINLQDWLPATKIQLIEEWSDDIQNIKAGDPVTRTITIAAEGLTGVQLPDFAFDDIKGLKQYPDKAIIEDRKSSTGIIGLKQIKVALIPASSGTYTLPAIEMKWWNTKTNKPETVSLPKTVITVTGVANTTIDTTQIPAINIPITTAPSKEHSQLAAELTGNEAYWKWLSLFLTLAWLTTLYFLLRNRRTSKNIITKKTPKLSIKPLAAEVEKQAKKNDAKRTIDALVIWAKPFYKSESLTNLAQITDYCSDELAIELRKLNQALYSLENTDWGNNKEFLNAFKNEQRLIDKNNSNKSSALKPLYEQ